MAEGTRAGFHQETMGEHSLSGYCPISSAKRPVRTRMRGVGGRGREKLPLTRLEVYLNIFNKPSASSLASFPGLSFKPSFRDLCAISRYFCSAALSPEREAFCASFI